jgi:hypothetical protein
MVKSVAPDRLADQLVSRVRDAIDEGRDVAVRREAELRRRIHGSEAAAMLDLAAATPVLDAESIELEAAAHRAQRPHPARYTKSRR